MKLKRIDIRYFKGIESVEINNCGNLNALIGKNNAGKSSVLHALEMSGLALNVRVWNFFQPKIEIKDLFSDIGAFEINITYEDNREIKIKSNPVQNFQGTQFTPQFSTEPDDNQKFKSILILPDPNIGSIRRKHKTPKSVIDQIEQRNYSEIDSLSILYAIKYYSQRNERGLTPASYQNLINEVVHYFPDLEDIGSDRTEDDVATLTYTEYGNNLDILYSGTGLKIFLDILVKTTISGANVVLIDHPELGLHPDLQRQFLEYLQRLAEEKEIQFFLATHSHVILNYADSVNYYRVINKRGNRKIIQVTQEAIHTILSDLGIRPSDIFNHDICLLVEGASEIIFFEHIIRKLYQNEFDKVAVAITQYGGSAAEGIINRSIDVSNITPAQKYTFWIRDRDAKPTEEPFRESTKFKNRLTELDFVCHIWKKREIEYYYPEAVHIAAQQKDSAKEAHTLSILNGEQGIKYSKAAESLDVCVPKGKYLRKLLSEHLTSKEQLDEEIRKIIEDRLIPWKKEILGE